jgi:mycothiol system anti-sigma-R factor
MNERVNRMPCDEPRIRLQAYFDGELDAVAAAEIERHLEDCADCRAALGELEEVRAAVRRDSSYERAPAALRARISAALDLENAAPPERARAAARRQPPSRRGHWMRPFWSGAFGGAAVAACAAFFLWAPMSDPLLDDLVNAHVRSLMPAHLIDVESTDRHTVKPWFAGHADVSPTVTDFAEQGYKLIGGRADYFDRQRAAVVVYQHGAHLINVFSWSADRGSLPKDTTRNGYHLAFWRIGNLNYCAVSDTGWDELSKLETLMREGTDSRG